MDEEVQPARRAIGQERFAPEKSGAANRRGPPSRESALAIAANGRQRCGSGWSMSCDRCRRAAPARRRHAAASAGASGCSRWPWPWRAPSGRRQGAPARTPASRQVDCPGVHGGRLIASCHPSGMAWFTAADSSLPRLVRAVRPLG